MFRKALVSKLVNHISPVRGSSLVVSGKMADRSDDFGGLDVRELSQVYATFMIKEYVIFEHIPYLSLVYYRERDFGIPAATGPGISSYPRVFSTPPSEDITVTTANSVITGIILIVKIKNLFIWYTDHEVDFCQSMH